MPAVKNATMWVRFTEYGFVPFKFNLCVLLLLNWCDKRFDCCESDCDLFMISVHTVQSLFLCPFLFLLSVIISADRFRCKSPRRRG